MTFEEWWNGLTDYDDGIALAVRAWDAAIEEAAKVCDENSFGPYNKADEQLSTLIRALAVPDKSAAETGERK